MGLVNDDENNVIASKFPQKGQKKKEAMEVRDDLFLSPPACDPIETAVVLNKYDVLVSLKPGTDIVRLAGIWDTVGKIPCKVRCIHPDIWRCQNGGSAKSHRQLPPQ
jgi:hypothetical protein